MPDATTSRCIACNGVLAHFGARGEYAYARCASCGTLQLNPFPTQAQLDHAYATEYAASGHYGTDPETIFRAAGPFYRAALSELAAARPPAGRVLDFGCGWGGLCRLLRERGQDYLGWDFESESLQYARSLGLNVCAGDPWQLAQKHGPFAAIVMITVFEHLANHDDTLRRLSQLLMPGGVLVNLLPTARLYAILGRLSRRLSRSKELPELHSAFCPPWHTALFSVPALRQMMERNGFRVLRITAAPSGKSGGLFQAVQLAATLVARGGCALFGERWPLVLNHIAVCQKP